jgi:hypothetical protein
MTESRHFHLPERPENEVCLVAHTILCKACDACESFHQVFKQLRVSAKQGTTTDAQQDTLRAMLVFACAGLDSAIKQLVRDALQNVIDSDEGAQKNFTESVKRKLPDIERSRDLLAGVLTARDQRAHLIGRLMSDLIADSLQSFEQLSKVAAAFNIPSSDMGDIGKLREAFTVRNQIIHEMDIDFRANRSRRSRKQNDMQKYTAAVLNTANTFLKRVDIKLSS